MMRTKTLRMRTKRPLREPVRAAPGPALKNYITPAGMQRLRDEHRFLVSRERPAVTQVVAWAASNGDRSENADYLYGKRRLRQIDSRIRFLAKRIDAAEVVDPAAPRPAAAAAPGSSPADSRSASPAPWPWPRSAPRAPSPA